MFYNFKKRNKFNIWLYILFLFFIIFFIKFSTVYANANTYKIVDLEISKPYDNNFNKEVVIDEAFEKAFEQIILKITTLESNDIINLKNLKTIYSLVESFSIVDEKLIGFIKKNGKMYEINHLEKDQYIFIDISNAKSSLDFICDTEDIAVNKTQTLEQSLTPTNQGNNCINLAIDIDYYTYHLPRLKIKIE